MERREDIRAAIQKLLSSSRPAEAPARLLQLNRPDSPLRLSERVAFSDAQLDTLRDLQDTLRANHIEAEIPEIVHAMLESLSARPSLCRGLVAAYLLGE